MKGRREISRGKESGEREKDTGGKGEEKTVGAETEPGRENSDKK